MAKWALIIDLKRFQSRDPPFEWWISEPAPSDINTVIKILSRETSEIAVLFDEKIDKYLKDS